MEIEIKVMWCKALTAFNFFQKLTIYAAVSIRCEDKKIELTQQQKQEQKTPVDGEGDGNPEWNHAMMFDLRCLESINPNFDDLSVVFEFRHRGQLFGDKTVGEVRVPLKSLIDSVGFNVVRFVSYEVRSPEGKHNGVLDFSYKVVRKDDNLENRPSIDDNIHSEINISGYHHHNSSQQLDWDHHNHTSHGTHTDVHLSEYHHIHHDHGQILHHHHQHYHLDQHPSPDPEKIQYPRIDLDDWTANNSSLVATNISHYPPPPVAYPPPPQHQWRPQPHQPPHFLPPPPPPVVYPPRPYGDSHWGYYRPPGNNQPNGGCDGYHHW